MTRVFLRNSCDQCRQAKVRCAFEPPTSSSCLRCIRRGSDCTRHPPLPLGRRPSASSCGIRRRRKNSTRASGAPPSSKHEPITPESASTMLGSLSSPTIPHGGGLAFSIGTPPTSGDSSMGIDANCWYRPTPSATSATTTATPHERLLAAATNPPPTTDASGSTSEYATLPLEWFNIDIIQTPICVSPPDERSGRSLQPPSATAAAEEALLPPPLPRSPPGRGRRGPLLPGCESEGGLFLRDDGAACQCSEDAADAMAALLQGGRVVTALDHVLRHANAAMAVLARFLVCRGRHQESDLLLICFLAQKVVTAYRQALCTCGASVRNGSGVQIPEIRVGSYRIVGEDGLLLMRQVVVVELRRLRRMVEQLRETMRDGGRGGCANAHSSSLLQGFLQAELKSVLAQAG